MLQVIPDISKSYILNNLVFMPLGLKAKTKVMQIPSLDGKSGVQTNNKHILNTQINLGTFVPGMYLVKVQYDSELIVQKILICD